MVRYLRKQISVTNYRSNLFSEILVAIFLVYSYLVMVLTLDDTVYRAKNKEKQVVRLLKEIY